ncbi:uncharacterized protein BJ212DRAFT_1304488 [Suillus subaureus]|uniref:Uncharacterized protein n=1 Tax=Suillus subaureus TaxID=48587 RepID=A0A9P7DV77_9AGAM|nr:uncharacterized protein BJ212DRAFT_1304488 [Suillus subaureus]KAG1803973.1 hypothetical protein BJ212DRAFT_1304488 [Suillus subaureus]
MSTSSFNPDAALFAPRQRKSIYWYYLRSASAVYSYFGSLRSRATLFYKNASILALRSSMIALVILVFLDMGSPWIADIDCVWTGQLVASNGRCSSVIHEDSKVFFSVRAARGERVGRESEELRVGDLQATVLNRASINRVGAQLERVHQQKGVLVPPSHVNADSDAPRVAETHCNLIHHTKPGNAIQKLNVGGSNKSNQRNPRSVKRVIKNKSDFLAIVRTCETIMEVFQRATKDATGADLQRSSGMHCLSLTLNRMISGAASKMVQRFWQGLFSVTTDRNQIVGWEKDLDRVIAPFNMSFEAITRIAISVGKFILGLNATNVNVLEMFNVVHGAFKESLKQPPTMSNTESGSVEMQLPEPPEDWKPPSESRARQIFAFSNY